MKMTDKEKIIIDGVDVSECCYAILPKNQCPAKMKPYAKETSCVACKQDNTKLNFCKNNPNCYFKQKVRKEQECEKLKEENQNLKNMYNSMSDLCEAKDEAILDKNADIEELSQHCFEYSDRIHNFKQALDEIEIYCKTAKGVATNKNDIEFFKMIIDIINKAKDSKNEQ